MGKKGDALRAAKAQKATYTFTAAQLEEHDRVVRRAAIDAKKDALKKYAIEEAQKAYLEKQEGLIEDFKERQALLTGDTETITLNLFSLLIAIPCRVLVKDFGWKPAPMRKNEADGGDTRYKLTKFAYAVNRETEELLNDETKDIRKYAQMVFEETGVMFQPDQGEEEENGTS
ncbi:MAG TPA: hypothetical protein DCF66_03855 [Lachnospiraceae bacterium]|nr:hypothetical protein [Lachnospiraceae bacterium]